MATGSSGAAARKETAASGGGSGAAYPGVRAGKQKHSQWTGVRKRLLGRWAAEIRVPRTRDKVWIGTFQSEKQAALAYDAAVFCYYGENLPKTRKLNFPDAPRPDILECARTDLSVPDNVKAIAEKHARAVDALLPPLVPTLAAPPVVAAAVAVAGTGNPYSDGAAGAASSPAPTAHLLGNLNGSVDDNNLLMTAAVDDDRIFPFGIKDLEAVMALVTGGY